MENISWFVYHTGMGLAIIGSSLLAFYLIGKVTNHLELFNDSYDYPPPAVISGFMVIAMLSFLIGVAFLIGVHIGH